MYFSRAPVYAYDFVLGFVNFVPSCHVTHESLFNIFYSLYMTAVVDRIILVNGRTIGIILLPTGSSAFVTFKEYVYWVESG